MDDALFVCRFEGVGDLPRQTERVLQRYGLTVDPFSERVALDQLHHQRASHAAFFEPVNPGGNTSCPSWFKNSDRVR